MRGDTEITNREDVIDSREVIARIEYLEGERETLSDKLDEANNALTGIEIAESVDLQSEQETKLRETLKEAQEALTEWDESDESQELKALKALQDEAEGYGDWEHGTALIRDTYFQEYAEQLADDIGAIDKSQSWPNNCIDWKKAADELKQDYTSVDFDGVDYWVQS